MLFYSSILLLYVDYWLNYESSTCEQLNSVFWKHQYVSHCTFIESLLCTKQKVLMDGDRKIKKAGAGFSTEELSREGKTDED